MKSIHLLVATVVGSQHHRRPHRKCNHRMECIRVSTCNPIRVLQSTTEPENTPNVKMREEERERKGYRTDLHRFPPPPDSCSEKVHHITEEYQFFTEWTNGANEQKAKKPLVWTHFTRNEFRAIGASETQPTTFSVDVIARDDETTCLRPGMRQT